MTINLGRIWGNTWRGIGLAAVFGPLALGVAQCSSQNEYDAWDERAFKSYWDNVEKNYYKEYRFVRGAFESIGDRLPGARPLD